MKRYKIHAPLLAVRRHMDAVPPSSIPTQGTELRILIQVGAILRVIGAPDESGLVEAEFQGQSVAVFQRDLDAHATLISGD